jgi:F-type H+-transporting ATPase subunit alpha
VTDILVGEGLLGRVIDPLGNPLDETGDRFRGMSGGPSSARRRPSWIARRCRSPCRPGSWWWMPWSRWGRGQRELILGDRQSGKTAIAIDTILNQRGKNVLCVYCAIGQRASAVAKVVARLQEKGAMEYTVVVVAEGNQAPGLAYITPYAATSIAEYFMEKGRDVLIIYDDLTHHARAYRELSLLLRRPPGREAFPGDIFYIHSRMLERSTHLSQERGGGSLTALPIIETEAQDISAYIPTNLISITDGQIYLSPTLFELGVLPAVDAGKSVSRVGGAAQRGAYRSVAGDLKLAYSQFSELESFAKFGTRLDESTQRIIDHGKRIRACFIQPESEPVPMTDQIVVLLALSAGLFGPVPLEKVSEGVIALRGAASRLPGELIGRLTTAAKLIDEDKKVILDLATQALAPFRPPPAPTSKAGTTAPTGKPSKPGTAPKPPAGVRSPEAKPSK